MSKEGDEWSYEAVADCVSFDQLRKMSQGELTKLHLRQCDHVNKYFRKKLDHSFILTLFSYMGWLAQVWQESNYSESLLLSIRVNIQVYQERLGEEDQRKKSGFQIFDELPTPEPESGLSKGQQAVNDRIIDELYGLDLEMDLLSGNESVNRGKGRLIIKKMEDLIPRLKGEQAIEEGKMVLSKTIENNKKV